MKAVHSKAVPSTIHWYNNPATYGKVSLVALAVLLGSVAVLAYLQGVGPLGVSLLGVEAGGTLLSVALLSVSSCTQPSQPTTKQRPPSQRISQTAPVVHTAEQAQFNLFDAVASGREQDLLEMVSRGVPIDKPNRGGDLPLHLAIKSCRSEVTTLLIGKQVGINRTNRDGLTPLHLVSQIFEDKDSVEEVIQALCANEAVKEFRGPSGTALHYAAMKNNADAIRALVAQRVNIDAKNQNEDTALSLAVINTSVNAIRTLIDLGADKFTTDSSGHNPYYHSQSRYSIPADIIALLNPDRQ